jgi:hypothetical protein
MAAVNRSMSGSWQAATMNGMSRSDHARNATMSLASGGSGIGSSSAISRP